MTEVYLRPSFVVRSGLVADPEGRHRKAMGPAVWAYLLLLASGSPESGERLVDPADLGRLLGASEETVRTWIGQLRKTGYLAVARDGRMLWIRILKWRPDRTGREARPEADKLRDTPRVDPAVSALAQKLGESPENPLIAEIISAYTPETIQQTLEDVLAVPDDRIKKSRLALLAYLLKRSK